METPKRPDKPTKVVTEKVIKKNKIKIDINETTGRSTIYIDGNKINTTGEFKLEGIGDCWSSLSKEEFKGACVKSPTLTITITNFVLES